MPRRLNWKEFHAGCMYAAFGIAALWLGRDYVMGGARAMGAGYLPKVLGGSLIVISLACFGRAVFSDAEKVEHIPWRKAAIVIASIVLFGVALQYLGLFLTVLLAFLLAASASEFTRPSLSLVLISTGFAASCCVIFSLVLSLPAPLWPPFI